MGPQRDDREQAEQNRGGTKDRLVGPLALGLHPELTSGLLKCDLDAPAADEPGEDVTRSGAEIGCQKGLRFEYA